MAQDNPFLSLDFTIAWGRMTPDQLEPAIREGIALSSARLDAIAALEEAEWSFESTFLALEECTRELDFAWRKASHLDSVRNRPDYREAYNRLLPEVSAFYTGIPLRDGLWRVLRAAADKLDPRTLEATEQRHIEETVAEFRANGADLPEGERERFRQISNELAVLTQKYSENVLDSTNTFELLVDTGDALEGLPASAREAAWASAEERGYHPGEYGPRWRFTLQSPSLASALKHLESDRLRRVLWEGSKEIGQRPPWVNQPLIWRILALRQERARLLGEASFADAVLKRRMARNGKNALRFVEDLHHRTAEAFRHENRDLEGFRATWLNQPAEPLEPWETAYWSEKLRRDEYALDDEELRPYFPIDRVIRGLFDLSERLFGIRIRERDVVHRNPRPGLPTLPPHPVEVWHPEVQFYEVDDAETGTHLGSFFADWFPREEKRGGAWMNPLRTGGPGRKGGREPHLGVIAGNLTRPRNGEPALLTHDEVTVIFHEFGHLLHHLLGDVALPSLNGTHVAWDFVELPSQLMENWCWQRQSLNLFARHYQTGRAIPQELFERMIEARRFQAARQTMRQLSFARMDLEMHLEPDRFIGQELDAALLPLLEDYLPPSRTIPGTIVHRFSHLFAGPVGYAAGYYSYKWAEVLDADVFSRFEKEGVMNPEIGREFRQKILSRGNAAPPEELFRDFMGRDPDPEALLRRDGLA